MLLLLLRAFELVVQLGFGLHTSVLDEFDASVNRKYAQPSLHRIEFVSILPKTRSGKIIRRIIKNLFENADIGVISTIEDKSSVDVIRKAIQG
mgnify:CR=1 FL=1